jgi:hypothetical protein
MWQPWILAARPAFCVEEQSLEIPETGLAVGQRVYQYSESDTRGERVACK